MFIGRSLVAELLKAGHEVTVMHRRPKHELGRRVQNIVADRNDPESVRQALQYTSFQVVFDNVYDWERGTTAAQVEGTVQAVRAASGDRLTRYVGPDDKPPTLSKLGQADWIRIKSKARQAVGALSMPRAVVASTCALHLSALIVRRPAVPHNRGACRADIKLRAILAVSFSQPFIEETT